VGASRTDAGVHALRQVASLIASSSLEPGTFARALNALLPPAVRVLDAREAPAGFDARRAAWGKRYAYLIDRGPSADPFLRRYAWHVPLHLDLVAMSQALRLVRGKHDFSAFCAAAGRGRSPICAVHSTRLVSKKSRLVILMSADSFLHHMVRNLVGSLVEIGRGAQRPEWIVELLDGRDRTRAGPTAPPQGLALVRVIYRSAPPGEPSPDPAAGSGGTAGFERGKGGVRARERRITRSSSSRSSGAASMLLCHHVEWRSAAPSTHPRSGATP
jgi:tRNA pseudouridine38-40 synthase